MSFDNARGFLGRLGVRLASLSASFVGVSSVFFFFQSVWSKS
jgi:hypothetical protein